MCLQVAQSALEPLSTRCYLLDNVDYAISGQILLYVAKLLRQRFLLIVCFDQSLSMCEYLYGYVWLHKHLKSVFFITRKYIALVGSRIFKSVLQTLYLFSEKLSARRF